MCVDFSLASQVKNIRCMGVTPLANVLHCLIQQNKKPSCNCITLFKIFRTISER